MEAKILKKALDLYGITEQHLIGQLSGGTYNAVYEFERDDNRFVIRIGKLEFDVETTNGMIEWLQYLSLNRAAVPQQVNSIHNNPLEYLKVKDRTYSVDVSQKIIGENARARVLKYQDLRWAEAFGQAVGKIHHLATTGAPKKVLQVRPHWDQIGNDFNPPVELSAEEAVIAHRRTTILNQIQELP